MATAPAPMTTATTACAALLSDENQVLMAAGHLLSPDGAYARNGCRLKAESLSMAFGFDVQARAQGRHAGRPAHDSERHAELGGRFAIPLGYRTLRVVGIRDDDAERRRLWSFGTRRSMRRNRSSRHALVGRGRSAGD